MCLVTPAHLSMNPRVVKEADALHEAGFDLHVVFGQAGSTSHCKYDDELLQAKGWTSHVVRAPSRQANPVGWASRTAIQRAARCAPSLVWPYTRLAELSESRVYSSLRRAAASVRADLYIGHYVDGLAAAGFAARHNRATLGFDAEDFHTGEANPAAELERVDFIQRRYLPECEYISAASVGIADALIGNYGVSNLLTIHNVFPWIERSAIDGEVRDRRGESLSLYWYSQVIGPDRGIQDAMRAMARLQGRVQLHLRGAVSASDKSYLMHLATELGIGDQMHFHAPVSPSELLSRAAEHDVGLALEQGVILNRAICATNKLFFFMLAGLAIAATSVPGQAAVLGDMPQAASLYSPGDDQALASIFQDWLQHREALARAKRASLEAARTRWNWEVESKALVQRVQKCLHRSAQDARMAQPMLAREF